MLRPEIGWRDMGRWTQKPLAALPRIAGVELPSRQPVLRYRRTDNLIENGFQVIFERPA
jgi:hypothetical protein